MTANIDPVHLPPSGAPSPAPAPGARSAGARGAFGAALVAAQQSAQPAASLPPVPPPELSAHIAAAARAWDALSGAGRSVVFNERDDGRLSIQLQDEEGNEMQSLDGSELFGLIDEYGGE